MPTIEKLQQSIIEQVQSIQDESLLEIVAAMLQHGNVVVPTTEAQYKVLAKSQQDIDEGRVFSNDEVLQMARQWTTKRNNLDSNVTYSTVYSDSMLDRKQ